MNPENNENMVRYFFVEVLEAAFNLALSYDAEALDRLQAYHGAVIKIKTQEPDISFFVVVVDEGIQLFAEHEGPVTARIRLPMGLFARYVLGVGDTPDNIYTGAESIRVSGDEQTLLELARIARDFNLWRLCKRILKSWLPQFNSLEDLLTALRSQDADWMARLEHLPQLVNQGIEMIRDQAELQQIQLREIRAIRKQLDADRRASQISTAIGLCLIVVAFLAHNGYLQVPQLEAYSFESLVLVIVALVLLIPRLVRKL
ncbi:MAG: hypothetical protein R3208_02860 [Ketobacteraceae bacterium]|nr:hypothetical protein [Ketobacteraceae bacterium]